MSQPTRQPVILLGASNLTLGWKSAVLALQTTVTGPTDLFVAMGMGRSYIAWSRFAARRLPGIMDCELWQAAAATVTDRPAYVLLTDLGNDLVYGRTPEQIVEAALLCIKRVRGLNPASAITVTGPPMDSISSMSKTRFRIARAVLFPGCPIGFEEIRDKAQRLEILLRQMAAREKLYYCCPRSEWYGLDPIHIRRRYRQSAFAGFYAGWNCPPTNAAAAPAENRNVCAEMLRSAAPVHPPRPTALQTEVFGRLRTVPQPCWQSADVRVYCY